MSAGHTLGPWRIVGENVPECWYIETYDGDFVAQCQDSRGFASLDAIDDARLIAAAPALLLELEMTVDLLERASRTLTEEYKSALDGKQWGGVRIASARAAIAFAKGEGA